MSAISDYISDPGWWFTAVVVATIVNVASEPLRRWLFQRLARLSDAVKASIDERANRRAKLIAALAESPDLLTLAYVRTGISLSLYLMTLLLLLTAPITMDAYFQGENINAIVQRFVFSNIALPALALLSFYSGFKFDRRVKIAHAAWKQLRLGRGLPSF